VAHSSRPSGNRASARNINKVPRDSPITVGPPPVAPLVEKETLRPSLGGLAPHRYQQRTPRTGPGDKHEPRRTIQFSDRTNLAPGRPRPLADLDTVVSQPVSASRSVPHGPGSGRCAPRRAGSPTIGRYRSSAPPPCRPRRHHAAPVVTRKISVGTVQLPDSVLRNRSAWFPAMVSPTTPSACPGA
jgi:hypothetical protein